MVSSLTGQSNLKQMVLQLIEASALPVDQLESSAGQAGENSGSVSSAETSSKGNNVDQRR